jgi:hypothetical protein
VFSTDFDPIMSFIIKYISKWLISWLWLRVQVKSGVREKICGPKSSQGTKNPSQSSRKTLVKLTNIRISIGRP